MNDLAALTRELAELRTEVRLISERQAAAQFRGKVGLTLNVLVVFGELLTIFIMFRFLIP
jgi:hypothetical protein